MTLQSFHEADPARTCDIAIVGAGVSGLYCAWRLLEADPHVTVTLIERLDRTGGRLDSDLVEVAPGEVVREEEGGMRFNFGMTELMTLNAALGLCDQIVTFPMGTPDLPNRFFIRGASFTAQEAADSKQMIWSTLYDLKPEEQGLSPTELVTAAYRNVLLANGVPYASGQTPEEWTHFRNHCAWRGIPLNQWQMWGLLRDMGYSEECIAMLSETIGFAGPFKSMANAGDAFQILADFPKDPHYYTFERGFSTLPNALKDRLSREFADRVTIVLSANAERVTRTEGEIIVQYAQTRTTGGAPKETVLRKEVSARQLVLAAPAKGCRDIFQSAPALRDAPEADVLWDALSAVLGMKLMKINLYFTKPWWQNGMTGRPPVQFGPSFSDLPINAVYPFYALPEEGREPLTGLPPIRDAAAALTIYCDFDNTNFWHGLQNVGAAFDSPLQQQMNARRPQVMYPASQAVVSEARRQLAALFAVNDVPEPVLTSYRLWDGEQPFAFAYHQWSLNADDPALRETFANPMPGVYLCNEAFSDMQGWVNGSLRSCDLALARLGEALWGQAILPLSNPACPPPPDPPAPPPRPAGLWAQ